MKLRIKNTGEVVDAEQVGHGVYCDAFGATHLWEDIDMAEEPIYLCDHIDWEQRRYEIARSEMQAMLSNPSYDVYDNSFSDDNAMLIASSSIKYADELIKQLKGGEE